MTQQTNEALGSYLAKIAKALDPVARAHRHGTKEVDKIAKDAMLRFAQYMARNKQNWDNVKFAVLKKYMTLPGQFEFQPDQINKIIFDSDTKTKVAKIINLPGNYMTAFYGQSAQPIGGDPATGNTADRAQVITRVILELAAIQLLDQTSGGQDVPDPTTTGGTATPTGSAASGSTAGAATPPLTRPIRQRSNDPTLDALYTAKYRVEMAMYVIQGGTP